LGEARLWLSLVAYNLGNLCCADNRDQERYRPKEGARGGRLGVSNFA